MKLRKRKTESEDNNNNCKKCRRDPPKKDPPKKDPSKKDPSKKKDPTKDLPEENDPTKDDNLPPRTIIRFNCIPGENNDPDSLMKLLSTILGGPGGPGAGETAVPAALTETERCNNPLCDHKTFEEDPSDVVTLNITKINNIGDLIRLGKIYHCKKNRDYHGLNLRILCNLVPPLTELQNMVGLGTVKTQIVNQILFFLRGYNKNTRCNACIDCSYNLPCAKNIDDMLHTIITGPPGVGKTQLGKILCKVYKEAGILSKGHFNLVSRSDFIAKYLGQTAIKTQKLIDKCAGGVMFIDEAYSLGHSEGRDSFSKECLDTLNQNLSEKRDLLCIVAGYKDALDNCFFSMNDGLARRFTFRYDITGYNPKELMEIFLLKLSQGAWGTEFKILEGDSEKTKNHKKKEAEKLEQFFKDNKSEFPNYGGDIETLFLNCKIAHCRKVPLIASPTPIALLPPPIALVPQKRLRNSLELADTVMLPSFNNRILSIEDIEEGFKMYTSFRKYDDARRGRSPPPHMYI